MNNDKLIEIGNDKLVTDIGVSPLAGIMPLIFTVLTVIVLFSALGQLRKGFTINKFIPWLLCAGIIALMALNNSILAQIGAVTWKVVVSIVSGIKITKV
jgi:hypothetical protein